MKKLMESHSHSRPSRCPRKSEINHPRTFVKIRCSRVNKLVWHPPPCPNKNRCEPRPPLPLQSKITTLSHVTLLRFGCHIHSQSASHFLSNKVDSVKIEAKKCKDFPSNCVCVRACVCVSREKVRMRRNCKFMVPIFLD